MIKNFIKFLGIQETTESLSEDPASETESVRKILQSLDELDSDKARYLALFASILSRVAHADLDISATETRAMEEIVMKLGGLDPKQTLLVIEIAKNQNRLLGGVENYLITREFAKVASSEQCFELMEALFAVAVAEEGISSEENQEILKISEEIGLSRQDFLAVRSQFKKDLNALKGIRDS